MKRNLSTVLAAFFSVLAACAALTSCPIHAVPKVNIAVTTESLSPAVINTTYSASLSASGGVAASYSWSVVSGALPAGLTLAASGAITGAPSATGTASFTVQVADGTNNPGTKALSIAVAGLSLLPDALPPATKGLAYSQTITVSGGMSPYTFSIISGALPAGLSLNAGNGAVSGTTNADNGDYAFSVRATDSGGASAEKGYSISVISGAAVSLTTASFPRGSYGTAYSCALSASGGPGSYAWTIPSGSLPAGLSLNASTGLVSGTPSACGVFSFSIKAADSLNAGNFASKDYSIAIDLSVSPESSAGCVIAHPFSRAASAAGGTGPYSWSITSGSLPPGLSLNASTGLVSGTPTAHGTYAYGLHASDASSPANTGLAACSIIVETSEFPTPYMVITSNAIYNVSVAMEYSLNDGSTWADCAGSTVSVAFAAGEKVWVRVKADTATSWYLGEVSALAGPDLCAGNGLYVGKYNSSASSWDDITNAVPGETMWTYGSFQNAGTASGYNANCKIRAYLSSDRNITAADYQLTDVTYGYNCPIGKCNLSIDSFTVPAVSPGTYYVGLIVDATNAIPELSEDNNASLPENTVKFIVKDTSANASGAFKLMNSWGTSSTNWENIADGHYWVSYESMKALGMYVWYYDNTVSPQYKPTIIALFKATQRNRGLCKITLGVGNPAAPLIAKNFQSRGLASLGGAQAFPDNEMALDISEFAPYINTANLYLSVASTDSAAGSVDSFSVEYYSVSDQSLLKTVTGSTGAIAASAASTFSALTTGALSADQCFLVMPLPRSVLSSTVMKSEYPGAAELSADKSRIGVFQKGKNYNVRCGEFGTGFAPPSDDEWAAMKKLRSIQSGTSMGVGVDQSADLSKTQYFPPVGNQGNEGSCVCWAFGYYTHTNTMAREFGWDLSGTGYGGANSGAPLSNTDRIINPDFIYHQVNSGVDQGSSYYNVGTLLTQMGAATWATMPYTQSDVTTWPSAAAFREAAKYRAREADVGYWDGTVGFFRVSTDADVNLLKSLILSGQCGVVAIQASGNKSQDNNLYHYLNDKDVITATSFTSAAVSTLNHAQTVVGFKDGTAWDPEDPDL